MSKYGVYSKDICLGRPDGRTKEAKLLRQTREALFDHLGGEANVSTPKRMLVERCAQLQLRLTKFEEKVLSGISLTDLDNRTYTSFSNALTRTLARLGLEAHTPGKPAPTLAELFPGRDAVA